MTPETENTEDIELDLLLEAVFRKYGYDFRQYSRAHAKRRVLHLLDESGLPNISAMQHRILSDPIFMDMMLKALSINVTEMFRDPPFYGYLRDSVLPELAGTDHLKLWHAGCSSGEEVYSMAILLMEMKLYNRAQIYATDFNDKILQFAREGIYPIKLMRDYTRNYQRAGGRASFSDYYKAKYDGAMINESLKRKIVFANHNLVTDSVFGEMNLVMCRNVLIYFTRQLQERVLDLFFESLAIGGLLCLGSKESLRFSRHAGCFETVSEEMKIYRKRSNY